MQLKRMKLLAKTILCSAILVWGSALTAASEPKVPVPTVSKGTYLTYVKVTWKKVSGSPEAYYVKRGTTSTYADAVLLSKCSKSATSYLDTSAIAGKTYYYWVCPVKGNTLYYNKSAYASGYRKGTSSELASGGSGTSGGSTSGSYISGGDKLSYALFNQYTLYVDGQKVLSTSVKWSVTGKAFMTDMGYYGMLLADRKPTSTTKVTVKAVYNKKTYTKTVTIYKNGNYGTAGKSVDKVMMYCSKHGWYNGAYTFGKCPSCKGTINW